MSKDREINHEFTYEDHHKTLVDYLLSKVAISDWHGVSDAANDLRVLEAQWEGVNDVVKR